MILNREEFRKGCGVKLSTFKSDKRRGHFVVDDDNTINTDNPKNKEYIHKKTKGEGIDLFAITGEEPKEKPSSPKDVVVNNTRSKTVSKSKPVGDLFKQKQLADLEKVKKDIELKQIDIEKKMGKLMPIDMVDTIFTINIQTILRSFESECENVISICVERLGGDRADISDLGDKMRELLHKTINNVKSKSKEEIEAVIKDYAVVRSRGERK